MSSRLQRWGERALGQVRSVSPRISSRFEPEMVASTSEEHGGLQEIEVESPVRSQPSRIVSSKPVEMNASTSPQPEIIEEKRAPVRIVRETVPPPAPVQPPPSPPKAPRPSTPRTIVAEPASVREEPERPQRPEPPLRESKASASPEPQPSRITTETSLIRLKRFEEWMTTPPRVKASIPEPSAAPSPKQEPVPPKLQAEAHAPTTREVPPLAPERPPAPPPPIVVSIGTIIVRANSAATPKAVPPRPAASLAAFLARRTAGQP